MSTSNDHLSSITRGSPPSRIGNHPPDRTASTWKDVEQALSLPTCLPSAVQALLAVLQHLLLTNNPPTPQAFVVVSECVRLLDDLILKSDPTIALTFTPYERIPGEQTALRNELKTNHADLHHLRQRVHSIKSVVRQLPQEIWQEIFFFVCPSEHNGRLNVFHLQNPLYVVSQVCRTWRIASHCHPQLWSQIVIATSKVPSQREGLLRLGMVLKRAQSVPLDFVFLSRRANPGLSVALLSLLTEYSHQWRSSDFRRLTPNEAQPLELIRGRIPELQALNLAFTKGGDVQRTDLISAFQSAPKLLRVRLLHFPLGQLLLDSSVKQNLLSLTIKYPDQEEDMTNTDPIPSLSEIIGEYPSLQDLHLFRNGESNASASPAPCVPRAVYTGLRALGALEGDFLDRVSLPSLTALRVGKFTEALAPGILPCVIGLLQHSRCRLKTLVLCSAAWDVESLGVLLALVPDLAALSVFFRSMQNLNDMLRILAHCLDTTGDNGPQYVPQLKTLGVHLSPMATQSRWTFIDKEFLDIVSMRADHGLKAVNLHGMRYRFDVPVLEEDDLRRWRELEKDGLIHLHRSDY